MSTVIVPSFNSTAPTTEEVTISGHIKGPLVAAFRSPLMKVLDRSVETLGLWIVTSSVTFIKSANQSSIKLCLIVHLVALWIYYIYILLYIYIYFLHIFIYFRREPVRKDRIILRASLETAIGQASGFSLLKVPRDHACDRKQRKLHLALIFECTFHRLTALASSCFFPQLFCLM